jgi:hypothetical protein
MDQDPSTYTPLLAGITDLCLHAQFVWAGLEPSLILPISTFCVAGIVEVLFVVNSVATTW